LTIGTFRQCWDDVLTALILRGVELRLEFGGLLLRGLSLTLELKLLLVLLVGSELLLCQLLLLHLLLLVLINPVIIIIINQKDLKMVKSLQKITRTVIVTADCCAFEGA
jgi:hypothetical protein